MPIRNTSARCALILIADGFEEAEAIALLTLIRQAGLCVKSVGLTSGPICGAHGVSVIPDLTLVDVDRLTDVTPVSIVILPDGKQSLSRLEADPRVHKLLRQVAAHRGQVITGRDGLRVVRAASLWAEEAAEIYDALSMPVLVREPEQPLETLVQELIRRLNWPPQA